MEVYIYADLVFAINLFMDFFIFWIGSRLIKKKIHMLRLFLGALLCATLYCVIIFTPKLYRYYNFFGSLIILMLGILVAFNPKKLSELIKLILYCHISAFAVGGVGMAVFYFTNVSDFLGSMIGVSINNFSLKLLITSTALVYIFIKIFGEMIKNQLSLKQSFCPVTISLNEEDISVNALIDTGNTLYDPLTGNPVIVAEFTKVKKFLPLNIQNIYYEHLDTDMINLVSHLNQEDFSKRLRMVPFKSLGKENGMLMGFKPDKVTVLQNGKNIEIQSVIIGVYNNALSNDGAYHALLSPMLFQENI